MLSLDDPKAEAITNNYDLLTQILARLPVKSLLRFKSVSKSWYSLISDTAFSRRVSPDEVSGLILHKNISELEFIPLGDNSITKESSLPRRPMALRILQSCHGLLLCRRTFEHPRFHDAYCIYNPTMEEFVELPSSDDQQLSTSIFFSPFAVSLAFDPTNSPHYKVVGVRIQSFSPQPQDLYGEPTSFVYQIEIYSSQTRSWKLSGNPFVAHKATEFCGGVFWNGAIHWIDGSNRDGSLYFNVEEERLQNLPMPDEGWEEKPPHIAYFGECGDHLHLIQLNQPYLTQFDVYEMERDYSRWFVKHRVDLSAITVAYPDDMQIASSDPNCYSYVIFCVITKANDEDLYMVLHIPGKVIQYNLTDGSFKKICEFGPDNNDDEGFPFQPTFKHQVAFQYIPTLSHLH